MQIDQKEFKELRDLLQRFEKTTGQSLIRLRKDLKDAELLLKKLKDLPEEQMKAKKISPEELRSSLEYIKAQKIQLGLHLLNAKTTCKNFQKLRSLLESLVPSKWVVSLKTEGRQSRNGKKSSKMENSNT